MAQAVLAMQAPEGPPTTAPEGPRMTAPVGLATQVLGGRCTMGLEGPPTTAPEGQDTMGPEDPPTTALEGPRMTAPVGLATGDLEDLVIRGRVELDAFVQRSVTQILEGEKPPRARSFLQIVRKIT